MKNTFLSLLAILTVSLSFSQDTAVNTNNNAFTNNTSQALGAAASGGDRSQGVSSFFTNPKRQTEGSVHLLKKWENRGVMITNDGKKYKVDNININLKNQSFVSKFHKDSLFSYSFNNLDKFVINNREFKNYFYNEDNRIYEIVTETSGFSILKGYKVNLVEGSANPMLNRKKDKYVQKYSYYLKTDNTIKPFKLKKNKILKLASKDQAKRDQIEAYAKEKNLSFRKPFDVNQILKYGMSL